MEPLLDVADADWIAPRLGGAFGAVTRFVPAGYPAYARLLHPAHDHAGASVSWARVAGVTGRRVHPLVQFHALIGSADAVNPSSELWPDGGPDLGNLDPSALALLCGVLARHTGTPDDCRYALWEGYGWVQGGSAVVITAVTTDPSGATTATSRNPPRGVDAAQLAGPRVRHPHRDYLLFRGPLDAVGTLGQHIDDWFDPQSPNLFWPVDRAWLVATEIDFDSTLIGGTVELIDELVGIAGLEVYRIGPDDSLAADADVINR